MVRWEARPPGFLRDVRDAQRPDVGDQCAKEAESLGEMADRSMSFFVDAHCDELRESRAVLIEHAERPVAGAGQVGGGLDNPSQN